MSFERFFSVAAAVLVLLGYGVGYLHFGRGTDTACAEVAETTRLQSCVKAGGSWVSGNCVGPLPAPEGK